MIRYQYIWSEKVLKLSHLGRIWLWDQIWHPWGKGWIDPMKKKVLKHNLTMWTVIKYKVMAFLFLQAWICPLVQERFVWEKTLFMFISLLFRDISTLRWLCDEFCHVQKCTTMSWPINHPWHSQFLYLQKYKELSLD